MIHSGISRVTIEEAAEATTGLGLMYATWPIAGPSSQVTRISSRITTVVRVESALSKET
jgi:hypothetical protein